MRTIVLLAAMAVGVGGASGGASPQPLQSWVDRQHRWVVGPVSPAPLPLGGVHCGAQVCETNDSGRHWEPRFSCCNEIFDVVRTSRRVGVVSGGLSGGVRAAGVWWTVGRGRWFPTQQIDGDFEGRGRFLFWHRHGTTLYEVRPWPPAGPIPCLHATKTWPVLCDPEDTLFASDPVAIIPDGQIVGLANIPGGVVAPVAGTPPRVLIRRNQESTLVALSDDADVCAADAPQQLVQVRWPRLFVRACGAAGHHGWRSVDGGRTWQFLPK